MAHENVTKPKKGKKQGSGRGNNPERGGRASTHKRNKGMK